MVLYSWVYLRQAVMPTEEGKKKKIKKELPGMKEGRTLPPEGHRRALHKREKSYIEKALCGGRLSKRMLLRNWRFHFLMEQDRISENGSQRIAIRKVVRK